MRAGPCLLRCRSGRYRSGRPGGGASWPSAGSPDAPFVVLPGLLTVIVIAVAVILTLGLGLLPGPVLDLLTIPLPLLS